MFSSYYGVHQAGKTIFDTNRAWTGRIDLLAKIFPECRMICCVRHVPWIIDSVERLVRGNTSELSGIFSYDKGGTVYSRAEGLMSNTGMIGFPLAAMKQAMHSAEAARMLLLPYDTLVSDPAAAIAAVYAFIGVESFAHDFDTISFDTAEFDARLGTPGLHNVRPKAARVERQTTCRRISGSATRTAASGAMRNSTRGASRSREHGNSVNPLRSVARR